MGPQTYVLRTEDTAITTGDCISSHNTPTHTRIYVFGNFYWNSWGIFRLR